MPYPMADAPPPFALPANIVMKPTTIAKTAQS